MVQRKISRRLWALPAVLALQTALLFASCSEVGKPPTLAEAAESSLEMPDLGATPAVLAPQSTEDVPLEADEDNGQTGSLIPSSSCHSDEQCVPSLDGLNDPSFDIQLDLTRCAHVFSAEAARYAVPACQCYTTTTTTTRSAEGTSVLVTTQSGFAVGAGYVSDIWGEDPGCLVRKPFAPGTCEYCAAEFPGCTEADASNACQAVCEDVVSLQRAIGKTPHDTEVRLARCTDRGSCQSVLRVDDLCYNQYWDAYSCSLGDEAIASAPPQLATAPSGCSVPSWPCERAEDCPRGLACNGSVCGPCLGDVCSSVDDGNGNGVGCLGDGYLCGAGEACAMGTCVRQERAECLTAADCPTTAPELDPRACLISGIDELSARGNSTTRTYCTTPMPNCYGLRVGDTLDIRLLDSGATPGPGVGQSSTPVCSFDPSLVLAPDLALQVQALQPTSPCMTATASLAEAGVSPSPPEAAHPRDPAEGRFNPGPSGSEYALLSTTPKRQVSFQGCEGALQIQLYSVLLSSAESLAAQQAGTLPTTFLYYSFDQSEESRAACPNATWPICGAFLPVQVTRRDE
jgi:hypothetical protein